MLHEGPYNIVLGDGLIDEGRRRREAAGTYLGAGEEEAVEPLYDVVTIGGWSMTVAGWEEGHGAGVQTVNGFWGEKNHRLSVGLTREQVEDDMWCWGFGIEPDAKNHFAIVAVAHGNPRRWPMTFPDIWWNYLIPEEQIFARSVGVKYGLGPVCLRLRFGVFEG